MEQRVSLITLAVADMEASRTFYRALGWREVDSPDGVIAFDLIGQTLGLYPKAALAEELGVSADQLAGSAIVLSHNVRDKADVALLLDRARAAGARVIKEAQDVFWGGHHGHFADPDGHVWEVAWNPHAPLSPEGAFRWTGYP
ncbi:VOC family protein [Pontivivens ytuae]|uniref:VOC family protein n=1 Tax=Pontivivens ytuae TaxID=2789856 RepID=A0A7S9LQZ8_9RHOB|nr:VOC family protein [Pontivivens ytuae]QPH53672.1 VOC family protein [Pontivivens ytuae]